MEMAEPLTKFERSQVALSIEVTVPGTGHIDSAKSVEDEAHAWWIVREMPLVPQKPHRK